MPSARFLGWCSKGPHTSLVRSVRTYLPTYSTRTYLLDLHNGKGSGPSEYYGRALSSLTIPDATLHLLFRLSQYLIGRHLSPQRLTF